ncbi:hypothetical protein EDB84DRAFT_1674193 [Lactarius hengduanensis]|nr:hypothetical protein EDB84DRAFT_1674193 [Lactarius hengduanensis]
MKKDNERWYTEGKRLGWEAVTTDTVNGTRAATGQAIGDATETGEGKGDRGEKGEGVDIDREDIALEIRRALRALLTSIVALYVYPQNDPGVTRGIPYSHDNVVALRREAIVRNRVVRSEGPLSPMAERDSAGVRVARQEGAGIRKRVRWRSADATANASRYWERARGGDRERESGNESKKRRREREGEKSTIVRLAGIPGAVEWPDLKKSHKLNSVERGETRCYFSDKGAGLNTGGL